MGKSPEELRGDIARTRDNLSGTLDAIEDRVVPGRIIERRRQAAREWVGGVRERVMGPPQALKHQASSAADRVGEGMSQMTDKISDAPAQLQQATAGSPLIAVASMGPMSPQISRHTSAAGRPSAQGCLPPMMAL